MSTGPRSSANRADDQIGFPLREGFRSGDSFSTYDWACCTATCCGAARSRKKKEHRADQGPVIRLLDYKTLARNSNGVPSCPGSPKGREGCYGPAPRKTSRWRYERAQKKKTVASGQRSGPEPKNAPAPKSTSPMDEPDLYPTRRMRNAAGRPDRKYSHVKRRLHQTGHGSALSRTNFMELGGSKRSFEIFGIPTGRIRTSLE